MFRRTAFPLFVRSHPSASLLSTTLCFSTSDNGSRHANKIRKTRGVKLAPTSSVKKPTGPKPPMPKRSPNNRLLDEIPAKRVFTKPVDEDSDLSDPSIMQQVEALEKEHEEARRSENIKDFDIEKIGEGERSGDEEQEELDEKLNMDEPAFSISKWAKPLSKARNLDDLSKIPLGFTCDEYVAMLEDEQVHDITVIDIRTKSSELDYLITATLHSGRHRRATGGYLYQQNPFIDMLQAKKRYQLVEEYGSLFVRQYLLATPAEKPRLTRDCDEWVCVDCGDVCIHLFSPETKKEYNLQHLWEKETKEYDEDHEMKMLKKNEQFLLQDVKRSTRKKHDFMEDEDDLPLGESDDEIR